MALAALSWSASLAHLTLSALDQTTLCKVKTTGAADLVSVLIIFLDYAVDWAIVQTQEWSTLYILSRERQPSAESIDVSKDLMRLRRL